MIERITICILALVSICVLPWWIGVSVLSFGLIRHPWFFEGVAVALIADVLYRMPFPWTLTTLFFCAVMGSMMLRGHIRMYEVA